MALGLAMSSRAVPEVPGRRPGYFVVGLDNNIEIEHACEESCACTTCRVVGCEGFASLGAPDSVPCAATATSTPTGATQFGDQPARPHMSSLVRHL